MTPERVIEAAIGLYDGPRAGADAPPRMAGAVMAALTEHGYRLVRDVTPAEEEADRAMWSEP